MKKIAFFDVKQYDIASFDKFNGKDGLSFKYFETRLTPDTVQLARGFDGICVFVNDIFNELCYKSEKKDNDEEIKAKANIFVNDLFNQFGI